MKSTTPRNLLRRRAFLLTLFLLPVALSLQAQMLFSENMTMKIDSSKPIQGTFSAMVNFKTEHEELFEVKTFSNLNILIGSKRVINLMGRFEFTTYGSKVTANEGDLHAEFRYLLQPSFEVYPYVEAQWAGTRGLIRKVSTGVQARYRPIHTEHSLMFLTTALFYEAEDWKNLSGDTLSPPYGYNRNIRLHLSTSYRHRLSEKWEITATAIHQANPRYYFSRARFGGALDLKFHLSKVVGLRGTYRFIYDTSPVVPMRKMLIFTNAYLDIAF